MTIFVSTAYLDEAERAHRLALIDHGRLLAVGTPAEVKQLMRGTILEVRSAEPRRTAAVLRSRLTAKSVGLFGDHVHVVCTDPDEAARQAGQLLSEAGIPPQGFRTVEPSLEDVFVSVLGREGPEGEAGGRPT